MRSLGSALEVEVGPTKLRYELRWTELEMALEDAVSVYNGAVS